MKGKFALRKKATELLTKAAAKKTREHFHWQKEIRATGNPALAIKRETASGNDTMPVRMMAQLLEARRTGS